ncbi:MAG: hypothetical protein ACOX8B_05135 [Lachnospiraceae bacterium]|jgi:hypothetical protein
MDYINGQNLSIAESAVGFDLNEDGDMDDTVDLTIEYDEEQYADTNGYGGTYLTLYLDEFISNLQWYLDSLDYAEGWTWFDADGSALSGEEVAAMTTEDKAEAFLEGRYAKSETSSEGGPGGAVPGGMSEDGTMPDGGMDGEMPGNLSEDGTIAEDGTMPEDSLTGEMPEDLSEDGTMTEDMSTPDDSADMVSSEDAGTGSADRKQKRGYSHLRGSCAGYEEPVSGLRKQAGQAFRQGV